MLITFLPTNLHNYIFPSHTLSWFPNAQPDVIPSRNNTLLSFMFPNKKLHVNYVLNSENFITGN